MATEENLHVPITKGGFSNDGSAVVSRVIETDVIGKVVVSMSRYEAAKYLYKQFLVLESRQSSFDENLDVTISSTLQNSGLTLCDYYDVDGICEFLQSTSAKCIAIQFPDELLTDGPLLVDVLKYRYKSGRYYILGDTSYGSCCVDEVSSKHVNADVMIHIGVTCFSSSPNIPVYYVYGKNVLQNVEKVTSTNFAIYNYGYHPCKTECQTRSLDLSIPSKMVNMITYLASPAMEECVEDIDITTLDQEDENNEYDDEAEEYVEDQSSTAMHIVKRACVVFYDRSYIQVIPFLIAGLRSVGINCVCSDDMFVQVQNVNIISQLHLPQVHTITLVFTETMKEATYESINSSAFFIPVGGAFTTMKRSILYNANGTILTSPTLQYLGYTWKTDPLPLHQMPNHLETAFVQSEEHVLPNTTELELTLTSAKKVWQVLCHPKQWTMLFLSACDHAGVPNKASESVCTNIAMNFPMHRVYNITVDDTNTITHTLISGTNVLSRNLSRRYYMVEKAKNAFIFGIVVCTLVAKQYKRVIDKMQQLLHENGKKSYVQIVGKVNEPKLLNFPDIDMFIMVSCPLSVLLQSASNISSVQVITPIEAELAFGENRQWDGNYSTNFIDIFAKTGRLGQGLVPSTEEQFLMDNNVSGNLKQDKEHVKVEEEEEGVPRFSTIDGKLRMKPPKQSNNTFSTSMVEIGAGQLVDAGYTPYKRTYTGLEAEYTLTQTNMEVQQGLFGIAKGYTTIDSEDQNKI